MNCMRQSECIVCFEILLLGFSIFCWHRYDIKHLHLLHLRRGKTVVEEILIVIVLFLCLILYSVKKNYAKYHSQKTHDICQSAQQKRPKNQQYYWSLYKHALFGNVKHVGELTLASISFNLGVWMT